MIFKHIKQVKTEKAGLKNMTRSGFFYLMLLVLAGSFTSCDKYRIYETISDFKDKTWYADSTKTFTFQIEDTTITYNMLYLVRNTLDYPFHNLYIKYELLSPDGKLISSDLHEVQLMDSKTGEPFGTGLGDIFDNRFYALKKLKFSQKGTYRVNIRHYMRKDPLTEIMAFGIRVENTKPE